ncbi:hypothetical protein D1AOALGA4SA_1980 [Olavius algarvensis Delta 1 endosymbiont]|nr:hypothetical protein D1AOALGA4SA_1980 [Olavius algarvensis Delta 1 endosymbiont]
MVPGCWLESDEIIPGFVRRLLLIGEMPPEFDRRFSQGIEIIVGADGPSLPAGRIKLNYFDCILINNRHIPGGEVFAAVSDLLPYLTQNGCIGILAAGQPEEFFSKDRLDSHFNELGLLRYKTLPEEQSAAQGSRAVVAFREAYNPVAHARELAGKGQFSCSLEILNQIPAELIGDSETLAFVAAEKQRYYLDLQKSLPPETCRHRYFYQARREFAQVTDALPHFHAAYRTQADYWRHIGNDNMAQRLLRSIQHVKPDKETAAQLLQIPDEKSGCAAVESALVWKETQKSPRLLVITHDHSDYGMDTLFDGLCRVLGKQNVIEFPWKPVLHGQNQPAAHNYPCTFNHPAEPMTVEEIVDEIMDDRFDVILYADVVQLAYPQEIRRIMDAARHLPVALYDPWDNSHTPVDIVLKYIGRKSFDICFKREMLSNVDYGPNAFPMPFSYPAERINNRIKKNRKVDVFWAGKREWGLRPLYLRRIEQLLNRKFDETYDQAQYIELLQQSRLGLSFFGCGFDTVRYWEIPAHGGMLLAESPPIRIPYNFIDGESAVFFEDLPELEEKLIYYLAQPEKAARIASAGHKHYLKYHTTTARARQLLGCLEKFLVSSIE